MVILTSFRDYSVGIMSVQHGDATEVSCSLLYKNGHAVLITADYTMDVTSVAKESGRDVLDCQKYVAKIIHALASTHFRHWGGGSSPFLLPSPFRSSPFSFPTSLPLNPARGMGERCMLLSSPSGSGRSPAAKRI